MRSSLCACALPVRPVRALKAVLIGRQPLRSIEKMKLITANLYEFHLKMIYMRKCENLNSVITNLWC